MKKIDCSFVKANALFDISFWAVEWKLYYISFDILRFRVIIWLTDDLPF